MASLDIFSGHSTFVYIQKYTAYVFSTESAYACACTLSTNKCTTESLYTCFFCDTIAKNVLHFAQSIIGNWIQLDVVGSVSNLDRFIATGV